MSFLNNKKVPVAILAVKINPKNYFVSRVLRLFRAENENIRRSVRFPTLPVQNNPEAISTMYDSSNPQAKYLRCSRGDVVCAFLENQATVSEFSDSLVLQGSFLEVQSSCSA